jgi:hypothetical protein
VSHTICGTSLPDGAMLTSVFQNTAALAMNFNVQMLIIRSKSPSQFILRFITSSSGRAVPQEVHAAWVRSEVRSYSICGGQSDTGAGFLRVLRFPLPSIQPTAPHSSSIIQGWYNSPMIDISNCGLGSTPPQKGGKNEVQFIAPSRSSVAAAHTFLYHCHAPSAVSNRHLYICFSVLIFELSVITESPSFL